MPDYPPSDHPAIADRLLEARGWAVKQESNMRELFFSSAEGRILAVGLALTALMLLAFGVGWRLYPDAVFPYAIMTGLNLIIGREAGMTFGYARDFGHAQVVPLNILIETIQVLVVYPLFVLSTRHLIQLKALQPFIERMQHAAESRGGAVRHFGVAGLFVFVFVPFWMTGPVVGAIIGFLIGLRPWVNLLVVLVSTYIAIAIWGLLLNELSDWAGQVNRFAPYALVLAIVLIAVAMHLLHRNRKGLREEAG
jgi:uncharacterized membrane protein